MPAPKSQGGKMCQNAVAVAGLNKLYKKMGEEGFDFSCISVEDINEEYSEVGGFIMNAYAEVRDEMLEKGPELAPPKVELAVDRYVFICGIP